jgi:hypothetical protein
MPTAEDLDDPDGFVRGRPELDVSELDSLTEDPGSEKGEAGPETEGPSDPDGPKES